MCKAIAVVASTACNRSRSCKTKLPYMLQCILTLTIHRRAKELIEDIVSRGHESTNGQSGSMQEMIIPAGKAGLIIGKGGETIKQLQVMRRLDEKR